MPDLTYNYAHAWDRMRKGIDEQGPYYIVSYKFANWANSDDAANQLMGKTYRTGTTVYRTLPHAHPLSPNLFCVSADIEGIGGPVLNTPGYPSFDGGFYIHATYRPLLYISSVADPGNQNQIDPTNPITTWCTQELDYETEVIPHSEDNQYTYTASGTDYTGIPIQEEVQITTMVLTFHQVPYLPRELIRAKRNMVNSTTFWNAPAETVRFINARTTVDYQTDGTTAQKVQMIFKERDIPWNKLLKKDGTWAYVYRSDGTKIFRSGDLTPLLNP